MYKKQIKLERRNVIYEVVEKFLYKNSMPKCVEFMTSD